MLTFEVLAELSAVADEIDRAEYLEALFSVVEEQYPSVDEASRKLAQVTLSSDINSAHTTLRNRIEGALTKIKALSFRGCFADVDRIDNRLQALFTGAHADVATLEQLGQFSTAFEQYLDKQTFDKGLALLEAAHRFYGALKSLRDVINVTRSLLGTHEVVVDEQNVARLTLILSGRTDYFVLVEKLHALASIYREIGMLLAISEQEHGPSLIKVESGSLLVDLLGYPKIVDLIVKLIDRSVAWMYRSFTREGRYVELPRQVETIESLLGLASHLREHGLDTVAMDEEIKKASFVLAQNLSRLLQGEPRIEINGQVFGIGREFEVKYIEESRRRQIAGSDAVQALPTEESDA